MCEIKAYLTIIIAPIEEKMTKFVKVVWKYTKKATRDTY